jgi:hypothetical protein
MLRQSRLLMARLDQAAQHREVAVPHRHPAPKQEAECAPKKEAVTAVPAPHGSADNPCRHAFVDATPLRPAQPVASANGTVMGDHGVC